MPRNMLRASKRRLAHWAFVVSSHGCVSTVFKSPYLITSVSTPYLVTLPRRHLPTHPWQPFFSFSAPSRAPPECALGPTPPAHTHPAAPPPPRRPPLLSLSRPVTSFVCARSWRRSIRCSNKHSYVSLAPGVTLRKLGAHLGAAIGQNTSASCLHSPSALIRRARVHTHGVTFSTPM